MTRESDAPFGYLLEKAGINNGYYFLTPADFERVEERFREHLIAVFRHPASVSQADDAKRITEAVLSALKAGGDHLAIYDAVKGALGAAQAPIDIQPIDGLLRQIRNRSRVSKPDTKEELARQMAHITSLAERALVLTGEASTVPSADRCARCGCETKGEVAWVNGAEWCHPCADTVAVPSTGRETPL